MSAICKAGRYQFASDRNLVPAFLKVSKQGFQGEMLKFLEEEQQDIPWKALLYKMPRGVLAWAKQASTKGRLPKKKHLFFYKFYK